MGPEAGICQRRSRHIALTVVAYRACPRIGSWAFVIWSLIFVSELVFVVWQSLPSNRNDRIIVEGVSFWFGLACILQVRESASLVDQRLSRVHPERDADPRVACAVARSCSDWRLVVVCLARGDTCGCSAAG